MKKDIQNMLTLNIKSDKIVFSITINDASMVIN